MSFTQARLVSHLQLKALLTNVSSFTALAVAYKDSDIRNVTAIVLGTPGTPYQFGLFEVCAHSH
jgi:ubiquitin-conjugating enzyme E2 Z